MSKLDQDKRANIHKNVATLDGDDLEILNMLSARVRLGRMNYGPAELSTDGRDFIKETLEETIDGLYYVTAQLLKLRRGLR